MADNRNPIFKIDTEQVLGKLHVIACLKQADISKKTIHFLNSGIVGMTPLKTDSHMPEVKFDLGNLNGVYELGVVVPEYKVKKDDYVKWLRLKQLESFRMMRNYFAAFAGMYKMKTINTPDLYAFFLDDGHLTMESFKSYANYVIPVASEIPDSIETDMVIRNLCYKISYRLEVETM